MFLRDLISTSFKSLFRRKLRTTLTVMGVTIGTIAIVLMLSIGYGLEETYKRQLESMGSLTTIDVYVQYYPMYETADSAKIVMPGGQSDQKKLDDNAIFEMEQIENVEAVIPLLRTYLKFAAGRYMAYVDLIGIKPEHMQYLSIDIGEGEFLKSTSTFDIVFGNEVLYQFRKPGNNGGFYNDYYYYGEKNYERQPPEVDVFNSSLLMTYNMQFGEPNPGGNPPSINYRTYKANAIGVLNTEQYSEYSYSAFMNIDQLKKVIEEYEKASNQKILENGYSNVKIKVNDIKNVNKVQEDLKAIGYDSYSLSDQLDSMNEMTKIIQLVLGGIAGVAFLIAAIGIANTMVMSIYERTKEIGVMKVLGCVVSTIRQMFLFEAALIGLTGGVLGTGISILISKVANNVVKNTSILGMSPSSDTILSLITPQLAFGAILFSTIVGIAFGLYPAIRATRISPLEAIRHE
ncbi:MAG: ABC transporter permease [Clostridia bacterium]|nr:ABC transporter permease [Clostridia bacterium]